MRPASLISIPTELHLAILTCLRATDLSSLQQTCKSFNNKDLIFCTIAYFASYVYPSELTEGFDTPIIGGEVNESYYHTFEALRNMEMLVVARVLSRPEPPISERESGFYVSKAWCRAALRWLDVQTEERKERENFSLKKKQDAIVLIDDSSSSKKTERGMGGKKSKKRLKKQERLRNRRHSDASPPWPNVNHDIMCEHGHLKCSTIRSTRAKHQLVDRMAWKCLKKLYPDSVQISMKQGECVSFFCSLFGYIHLLKL